MSKKITIIIFVFLVGVLAAGGYFFVFKEQPGENAPIAITDISKVTDEEVIGLLKTNNDSLDYIEKHKDFKIEAKTPLTKESILAGQKGENFKEVYQGLYLEDNRYLRADLMNSAGNWGLVAVLDFKNNSAVKAFRLVLMSAGVETK